MAQTFGSMGDLNTLMGGAVNERWQDALSELAANVLDPNTDPTKARRITMTLTVKPNSARDGGEMSFDIKKTLAPPVPVRQTVFFDMDDAGTVSATQRLDQVPGQVDMNGEITPQPVTVPLGTVQEKTEQPNVLSFK